MDEIKFNSYSQDYNFLSNFYTKENLLFLTIKGKTINFHNIETAFQSLKLLYLKISLTDKELIDKFILFSKMSCSDAKRNGNKLLIHIQNWEKDRVVNMEVLLFRKFCQNQELLKKLLDTKNSKLIEYNTGSLFWGTNKYGNGENSLGILLEKTRNNLKHLDKM